MAISFAPVFDACCAWAEAQGIHVRQQLLARNKAGEFDGLHITLNQTYDNEELTYYLVHALGSMVRWSLSHAEVQSMFEELRAAKQTRADSARLERAIERYRVFEIESSEFAVWLLRELGHGETIPAYTNFMWADLESLTEFHWRGQAPVWRDYFKLWNREVSDGQRRVLPFEPKPIPRFQPTRIENQEILQEQPPTS